MSVTAVREIEKRVDALAATPAGTDLPEDARGVVRRLLDALEAGTIRAAERDAATGEWRAVPWVKRGILLGFRVGGMIDMSITSANDQATLAFDGVSGTLSILGGHVAAQVDVTDGTVAVTVRSRSTPAQESRRTASGA